ncbi:hypothetical protein ACX27_26660 [Nostoc piscinale CENA21]|uniref:Phage tail protein n=1 Tax=Nostoc piscinale CENA21 TaxID=224013 RepID=A0A0M4TP27_9NOSO|nr:phage tail protein [Nostoc piscinale]ALF55611.1 hypothetical protein ACX27_26660 [Nostoc piscinale CENA21]
MHTKQSWETGRPIFSRLPDVYQENSVADWLTVYFDEFLVGTKALVYDLPNQFNPYTCDTRWLDYIAPLYGFSTLYWDRGWPETSKRQLLAGAYTTVWPNRGTRVALSYILSSLLIEHTIWEGSTFILGSSQLGIGTLGSGAWKYKILLPRRYAFGGYEFRLTQKIDRLFGNLWCESEVIYYDQLT